MDYHVTEAHYVAGYVVKLKFRDGTEGEIDLGPELTGPVFELLRGSRTVQTFSCRSRISHPGLAERSRLCPRVPTRQCPRVSG